MKWATPAEWGRQEAPPLLVVLPSMTHTAVLAVRTSASGEVAVGSTPDGHRRSTSLTHKSSDRRDRDVAPCAFVDWGLTSSRFYTVLSDLLEARIRLLTE